jgi:hypothetical protein
MNRNRIGAVLAVVSVFSLPASAQAATYAETVLADNPLTYLRMSETSGVVAEDATANDRDGAFVGVPALGVGGPFVDAQTAVGLTSTSSIAGTVDQASGSIELWINPARLSRGQQAGIAAHGAPSGDGWALGIGNKRKLAWVTGGTPVTSKVTLSSSVWTMLTVTWDSQAVRIYRNGVLAKAMNRNGAVPASSGQALVLGGDGAGAFTGSLNGSLDEVALYSQVLAPATILAHFQAARVPANTTVPAISGTPMVGETLTVQAGVWTEAATATHAYQWQRCDENGEDCGDIVGATGTTYMLAAEDESMTLQVAETVTNTAGASTAISDPTGKVAPRPTVFVDPTPSPDPTPTPDPTLTPPTGTTTGTTTPPDAGSQPAAPVAPRCLRVVAGRKRVKLSRYGRLHLKFSKTSCLTKSIPAVVKASKGTKLKAVRYTLDRKRLKRVKKVKFGASLRPARLKAGRHTLKVRVMNRAGTTKTFNVRLRVAVA